MDSKLTIGPRPGVVPRSNALRDPVTVREAVDTELDPSKTVSPAGNGDASHDGRGSHREQHSHELIDPQGQAAIISAVDVGRGEPPSQNQAAIRQRAYRQIPPSVENPENPADPHTDHADVEA